MSENTLDRIHKWNPSTNNQFHYAICRLLALLAAFAISLTAIATLNALQVLSPSSTPFKRIQQGSDQANANSDGIEPSRRLVIAMDKMISFDVIGGETEAEFIEAARSFLTGSNAETTAKLDAIKAKQAEMPPTPLLMATMLYSAGNNQQGRLWLEKAAYDYPKHPAAFIAFAKFSAKDKRIADAAAMLEKVDRLMAESEWSDEVKRMFRIDHLDISSDVAINQKNLEKAKEHLLELATLLPESSLAFVRLAQVEFDLENIDSSLSYLKKARELQENIRVPEVLLAEWFLKKSDVTASEKWITEAAKANPDNGDVQLEYARWLLQNEKLQKALASVTRAEELKANSYVVNYLKGQISFARQSYELAESHFEELIKQKPRDADANNMLALSLVESGEPEKMSRALELAVLNQQVYPRSPTALATVGWIYYRNGKLNEAEAAFSQIVQSNSLAPASAFFVATYLERKGDFAEAKRLLDQAVADTKYFMFRAAANSLLEKVNSKLPAASGTSDQSPESADKTAEDKNDQLP